MYRRICSLIGIVALAACAAGYGVVDDVGSVIKEADAAVAARNFNRAQVLYERALGSGLQFDTDLPHIRNLAITYLNSNPPDQQKAVKWLKIAVTLDPHSDSSRTQLAKVLHRTGDLEGSIENYRILAEAHPTSAEYVLPLAAALREAGKADEALILLQTTAAKFPELIAIRIEYARQLNFSTQFAEAKKQFLAVLAITPDNLVAQVGLAKAISYEGDQETAIGMYDRILQRHPGAYDAIVGKGFSLLWAGRTEQASVLLRQAAVRNPGDGEVREALSTLPNAVAGPQAGAPQERNHRAESPRRASNPRPPNPAKSEPENSTLSPDESPPVQQERQRRPGGTLVIFGCCLLVALFGYAVLRSLRRRETQASENETRSRERSQPPEGRIPDRGCGNSTVACSPLSCSDLHAPAAMEAPQEQNAHEIVEQQLREAAYSPALCSVPGAPEQTGLPAILDCSVDVPGPLLPRDSVERTGELTVLLVGGTPHLLELEERWLPVKGKVTCERNWADAARCLANTTPEIVVLNAFTFDGWSSERMFDCILSERAELRDRTVVISSRTSNKVKQGRPDVIYLLEPFGAQQWRDVVNSILHRCQTPAPALQPTRVDTAPAAEPEDLPTDVQDKAINIAGASGITLGQP